MVTYSKVGVRSGGGEEEGEKCQPSLGGGRPPPPPPPPRHISLVKPLPWQPEVEKWFISTFIIWLVKN